MARESVVHWLWRVPGVRYCSCYGILDYVYGAHWQCRQCRRWHTYVPSVSLTQGDV